MTKETLKERLRKKLEDKKAQRAQGAIFFQKADTTIRIRILNMGEEKEFIKEVTQFYLGADIKGVISPSTYGEPCGIQEGYEELKNSEEDDNREVASKFPPRQKYLAFCAFYKDLKGIEVDEKLSPKFILLSSGIYQEILEKYLDEDEWGDMSDPENGYDLKIKRVGSGKTSTEYSLTCCKPTPCPKPFRNKVYDLDAEVKNIIPTYEKTKELLEQFLGLAPEGEDNEPRRKKKVIKKPRKDLE